MMNTAGEQLLPFQFDSIIAFDRTDLIKVMVNAHWGMISSTEEMVIPYENDKIIVNNVGKCILAINNNKTSVYYLSGEHFLDFSTSFDNILQGDNRLWNIIQDSTLVYLNAEGQPLNNNTYGKCSKSFKNGYARVQNGSCYGS